MDKNAHFLQNIPPEALNLTLVNDPFIQKQHRDYWSIDNMKVNEYDLIICLSGQAEFKIGTNEFLLSEGSAFLIPPNDPISAKHIGDDFFIAVAQHFELKIFNELDFFKMINYFEVIQFSDWTYIKTTLNRFKSLVSQKIKKFEQHSLFNIILQEFIYDSFKSSNIDKSKDYAFIFQMIDSINSNIREKDVLNLALKFSPYSSDYTTRKFKKIIGYAPKQYIIKTKLNLARNLLEQDITIKETAFHCGFSDELYFSRVFKKYLKISPREYRKQQFILTTLDEES